MPVETTEKQGAVRGETSPVLSAQHPASEHGIGHHRNAKLLVCDRGILATATPR
jgi:hypothetical protein